MRIRIGNQTAFSASPMVPFEFAVANGFDAFEWLPDKKISGEGWGEMDLSRETREFIRNTALAHNIRLSVHAPWPSDPLKQEAVAVFQETVRLAQDIRASLVNIHFSSGHGAAHYAAAVVPFARSLAREGMMLTIENVPDTGPELFNELFQHIRAIDPATAENIGMCLDIGHANLHYGTRNDYLSYFDRLAPGVRIIHVHMHENYGDSDAHLTVFTGPSRVNAAGIKGVIDRLHKRNFSGSIILEQWPVPESLLLEARTRLLAMMPSETQGALVDDAPADLAGRIIEADRGLPGWKNKLEWVLKLLTEELSHPGPEDLVSLALYLRFIGTGQIRCAEDGTHYRPSHHARISRRIYAHLKKIMTPENALVIRKIYPWLPSFDDVYLRAEPLTLIRDIAHRNDIPADLKREIKTTLQNKLHRSAGPEDLVTSAALLMKITAPGAAYPEAFVAEFRLFHEELKDFFNAGSLKDMLENISAVLTSEDRSALREFLVALDGDAEALKTLGLLTALRRSFSQRLLTAEDAAGQQLRMTDIRLEDFSFTLLSRLNNEFEGAGDGLPWERSLACLSQAITNLRLSGLAEEECEAIESELKAWTMTFSPSDRMSLLRVRATLDRCRRLAEGYCARVLSLFPEKAATMGQAFGVSPQSIKFFSESDIRSHPVFQVSRLVSLLLKKVRTDCGLPPWDTIVPGTVTGRLLAAPSLSALPAVSSDPVIVVLEKADGEEEIPLLVHGIIIPHETPLLSHLAVRARQKATVFAVCEDAERFAEIKKAVGTKVRLSASAENAAISVLTGNEEVLQGIGKHKKDKPEIPEVSFSLAHKKVVPLKEITPEAGGEKAFSARRLEEISRMEGAGFTTPPGIVIPFGIMEEALSTSLHEEYGRIVSTLAGLSRSDFEKAITELKDMVRQSGVPGAVVAGVRKKFGTDTLLIVRSSANAEDLSGMSAAGLFDSVPNVRTAEIAAAISRVWSSLWNIRAAADMKNAGADLSSTHMAVLVQPMVVPEFSFILHTVNPLSANSEEVYLELAVGMGETLASAEAPGMPYRLLYNKRTAEVRTLTLASFSRALCPGPRGKVLGRTVDYSKTLLSTDRDSLSALGRRIGRIGRFVENTYGHPQDIEGLVSAGTIYLVQARPQQGDTGR